MRQRLCRRLEELEKTRAAAVARAGMSSIDRAKLDELWARVNAWHAVPENQQWVAAQPPEALAAGMREVRAQLWERAHGKRGGAQA